jgi:hypothetical protein
MTRRLVELAAAVAHSRLAGGEGYCTGVENCLGYLPPRRWPRVPSLSPMNLIDAGCCQDGSGEVGEEQEFQVGSIFKVLGSFDKVDQTHHDKQRDAASHDLSSRFGYALLLSSISWEAWFWSGGGARRSS